MEEYVYNLICLVFDDNIEDYKSLNSPEFVRYICEETGMNEEEYMKIMQL